MGLLDLSQDSLDIGPDATPTQVVADGNYRYALYTAGRALVYKGESQEPSYEITSAGCSCPASKYRSDVCKHRKFVLGLGDSSSGTPEKQDPEFNVAAPEVSMDDIEELFG